MFTGLATFTFTACTANTPEEIAEQDGAEKKDKKYKAKAVAAIILRVVDKAKDLLYALTYPHASHVSTYFLWVSIVLPVFLILATKRDFKEGFYEYAGLSTLCEK